MTHTEKYLEKKVTARAVVDPWHEKRVDVSPSITNIYTFFKELVSFSVLRRRFRNENFLTPLRVASRGTENH